MSMRNFRDVEAIRAAGRERDADALLGRLDRVRETGPDRWLACCPAHDDATPSLSIRETDDGRVLVHCFAGCAAADVVSAAGLELADLFPDRPGDHRQRPTRPGERWIPRDVLRAVADEAFLVIIAAEDVAQGRPLTEADRDRLGVAHARLRAAAREVGIRA